MSTQPLDFKLSNQQEQCIRTYACTNLKRWFVPPTIGYLTVTNKRLVFHSSGKSLTGQSLMISEMPLDDVAGISVYEGSSFNWVGFLGFVVLAYVVTALADRLLPSFMMSYPMAVLLMLPFVGVWLLSGTILSDQTRQQFFEAVERIVQGKLTVGRDMSAYLPATRILLYIALDIVAWRIAFPATVSRMTGAPYVYRAGGGPQLLGLLLLLVLYVYLAYKVVGRQHVFSLRIGSKTMKDSGIFIPGSGFRLFSMADSTATETLGASPAADAKLVTRELGALIMDIQQLGDLGVQKWKVPAGT